MLGHSVGDRLLREVARRLETVAQAATVARFEGDDIMLPNGVLVDGNRLIVASDGRPGRGGGGTPARLVAIPIGVAPGLSPARRVTPLTTAPIGTPDGVEKDGRGGYLLSDVSGGRILQVTPAGEVRELKRVAAQPADIAFIAARGLLVVPHLGLNRVSAYDLSDEVK